MERKYECARNEEDLVPTATVTSQTAGEAFAPPLTLLVIPCAFHNYSNIAK